MDWRLKQTEVRLDEFSGLIGQFQTHISNLTSTIVALKDRIDNLLDDPEMNSEINSKIRDRLRGIEIDAPLSAPTNVNADAGDDTVLISWSSVSGADSYNLYWSKSPDVGKSSTKISNVISPYTHTNRTNGTTYHYVVTTVNSAGESAVSSKVQATPTATDSETRSDYISSNIGVLKYVPAGTFQRDEEPENASTVSAFRMSQHLITRAQFLKIMEADPSDKDYSSGTNDPVQMVNWYHAIAFCNKLSLKEGLSPVYTVSGVDFSTLSFSDIPTSNNSNWNNASCDWSANGYRLPTEMEWKWAAMGAQDARTKAYAGQGLGGSVDDYTWHYDNSDAGSGRKTQPVGTKNANELGLFDMSGNV